MSSHAHPLIQLQQEIDARVKSVRNTQHAWPCCAGCDTCCQRLAEIPQITRDEWALLQSGLVGLAPEVLHDIDQRITQIAAQTTRPIVCPLLDLEQGQCRVYAQRPIACRTYGFYVQRELGLYCKTIEAQVANGDYDTVVWGNHDGIEHELKALGESRPLSEWYAEWQNPKADHA